MTPLFWTGIAVAGLFFLAYTVVPLWMTFKYPQRRPDFADARAYLRGKTLLGRGEAIIARPQEYRPAGVRLVDREDARQAA